MPLTPIGCTPDGRPLWLTGEVRVPEAVYEPGTSWRDREGEWYWAPGGPRQVDKDRDGRAQVRSPYPILTTVPVRQDPFLAGRITQALGSLSTRGDYEELLKLCLAHLKEESS